MSQIFQCLTEFSVRTKDKLTVLNIVSMRASSNLLELQAEIEELPVDELTILLPMTAMACHIGGLETYSLLAPSSGHVKQLTVETDQFGETHELEHLAGVERLGLAMQRPQDGLAYLDASNFISALLDYLPSDTPIEFILFGSSGAGPTRRKVKPRPSVQVDIAKINSLFAGFENYQGCTYQARMPTLIGNL